MITEDYCSYEVSELLKEKGFNEVVHAYHNIFDKVNLDFNISVDAPHLQIPCPTHQMAIAWILEKYNVSIEVSALKRNCWVYTIYKIFDNKVKELYNDGEFNSHEKAVEAAIKYYIENLI